MFSSWARLPTITFPRLCVISSHRLEMQPLRRPLAPAWSWAPDESVQGARVLTAKHVYAYADIIRSMSVKAVHGRWSHSPLFGAGDWRNTSETPRTLWGFILCSLECFLSKHKAWIWTRCISNGLASSRWRYSKRRRFPFHNHCSAIKY